MSLFSYFNTNDAKPIRLTKYMRALIGGFSGMLATVILHPLDVMKLRMQLYPHRASMYLLAKKVCRCEGAKALYVGLPAAILRQCSYTTSRIAVYHWLYEKTKANSGIPAFKDKVVMGMYASMVGAFAGGPSDIVLVRMLSDARKDPCAKHLAPHRRLYANTYDCFLKIYYVEGFRTYWRGGTLALLRAACVGIVQIGSYTQTREYLLKHKIVEGNVLHILTSFASGFITAVVTLPIDRIKVRYQVRRDRATYMQIYKGINKCGYHVFWAGFIPYFLRLSVHTSLTYIFIQKFTEIYQERWNVSDDEPDEIDDEPVHEPLDYNSPELQNPYE